MLRDTDRMRTILGGLALVLLLAGCGAAHADDTPTADSTGAYLQAVSAAEGHLTPAMRKQELRIAHAACKAIDGQPQEATYRALVNAASSGDPAMGKLRIDAAIGAFCPDHLNLKR